MTIRTKGRAKVEYRGRQFQWWIDNDSILRIASADKQFVVAYHLFDPDSVGPLLGVHGPEFSSESVSNVRPAWLVPPELTADSMGSHVAEILDWCFGNKEHRRFTGDPPA